MIKNITKHILSFLLICILIFTGTIASAFTISTSDSVIKAEKKILCTATIEDDFKTDSILVVLNKEASKNLNTFSKVDFSDISAIYVKDLTPYSPEKIEKYGSVKFLETAVQKQEEILQQLEYKTKQNNKLSLSTDDSALPNITSVPETTIEVNQFDAKRIIEIRVNTNSKQDILNKIKQLEKRNDIFSAEPNYISQITKSPNDTKLHEQWAINKINSPAAWDIATGSASIAVGVLDTGININHPDLVNRVNTSLSKTFNGINALQDSNGHGTHVAGIIGAQGNNGIGITGVCWNVNLVSLRVADSSGHSNYSDVIDAIKYANKNMIKILNYSASGPNDTALREAINTYNGLFVCSAGNDGVNIDNNKNSYPSLFSSDNIVSVANSDFSDTLYYKSNYGATSVDLAAPGQDILSTVGNGYQSWSGTSMAAPYVAGTAALIMSKYPNIQIDRLKSVILNNVDKVAALSGKVVSGGRLNAYKALKAVGDTSFTVQYNNNGGSGTMANTQVFYGVSTPLRANTFTKTGYHFLHWYLKKDGQWHYTNSSGAGGWYTEGQQPSGYNKTIYRNQQSIAKTTSANGAVITAVAQWATNTYTVQYNANGGSGTMASTTVVYGVSTPLRANAFINPGYHFLHWHLKKDGQWHYTNSSGAGGWYTEGQQPSGHTKTIYRNQQTVAKTTSANGAIVTAVAQWELNTFTIQYNANGGTGSMGNTVVTYGVSTPLRANTFKNTHYKFLHWNLQKDGKWHYTNPDGSGGWYTEGQQQTNAVRTAYNDQQTVARTTSENNGIITAFAQWTPTYFTVQYNANGGIGTMNNTIVDEGVNATFRKNTFTNESKGFAAWYIRRSSDNKVLYKNNNNTVQAWYTFGNQPAGFHLYHFSDGAAIPGKATLGINYEDTITAFASWGFPQALNHVTTSTNMVAGETITANVYSLVSPSDTSVTYTALITNPAVNYQWQKSTNKSTWTNISGATADSYTISDNDINCYIRVIVSNNGNALSPTGTVYSVPNSKVIKLIGDVNMDDVIDITDANLIRYFSVSLVELTDEQITAADVNRDGVVSILDSDKIQAYLAGQIPKL